MKDNAISSQPGAANERKCKNAELATCKTLANSNSVEAPAAGGELGELYKYVRQSLTSASQRRSGSGGGRDPRRAPKFSQ